MFIRQAEVYAAYLAYTDHEIGRVIQAVDDMGELDNTLIIYISGDNGSSAEGTLLGTPNEVAAFNGVDVPVDVQLKDFYDIWGTDQTYNHMAVPWTWAFDTPFRWTKQIAAYFGGTKQGMAIAWPNRITDKGGLRSQFAHVIDIAPTILDAVGIREPSMVDGIAQSPMEGTSLVYTFDKANADEPSHHRTQYFEMMGAYAIYHEGWMASTKIKRPSWVIVGADDRTPADAEWELFDISKDWTQAHDVSAANPDKLKELQDIFWSEAEKYQVLPLDASVATRLVAPRPSLTAGRDEFVWRGEFTGTPNGDAPPVLNSSFTYTAEVEVPDGGGNGMIVTQGGRFGGYGFYLLKGKPVFVWNLVDLERRALGRRRGAGARQAHAGVRLRVRRAGDGHARLQQPHRHRPARLGRAPRRRRGGGLQQDGAHHPADPAVGREPGRGRGHRDAGGRCRLHGAIHLRRHAGEADAPRRPAQAHPRRRGEASGRDDVEGLRAAPGLRGPAPVRDQTKNWAPFAEMVEPLMKPASSEARKVTMRAISSGSPRRPAGIWATIFSRTGSGTAITISVAM